MSVRAKKNLGQHFLKDESIAWKIAQTLTGHGGYKKVLEVGPGMGMLTKFLLQRNEFETHAIEIDHHSVEYLHRHYPLYSEKIIEGDFLTMNLSSFSQEPFAITGNFPYNISSQIFFKILEFRALIPEITGMLQREVAQRITSKPGNKSYGMLSVLLQAYYETEYLFTVDKQAFDPPPKVQSGVIRLKRNADNLDCDEKLFRQVVKSAFSQRRKTLHNSLRSFTGGAEMPFAKQRAEELSVKEFEELVNFIKVKQNAEKN